MREPLKPLPRVTRCRPSRRGCVPSIRYGDGEREARADTPCCAACAQPSTGRLRSATTQNAMNHLWGVPFKRRPDPLHARGRALLLLLLLGGGALATTILASLAAALNVGLFWLGFRLLTAREVSWRHLRGGAIAAGVLYELLQTLGGLLRRPHAQAREQRLRHLRPRYRPAFLDLPLSSHHPARRRRKHRHQETLATQLLARDRAAADAGGQARAHPARQGRGAPPRRDRQHRLPTL